MKQRLVIWYSHGAASLTAAKLAIDTYKGDREIVVANIFLKNECIEPELTTWAENFLGVKITTIQDTKYDADVNEVVRKTRYMSGVNGARCTAELKKRVRKEWQRYDDLHVFGMDINETGRIDKILDAEPDLDIWAPLIDAKMTKRGCFTYLSAIPGFKLPKMYALGYHNNNCIGCLKASGAGYWNKIRVDFPEVFAQRSRQEELLGTALTLMSKNDVAKYGERVIALMDADGIDVKKRKDGRIRVPLRYLPETAGTFKDLDFGSCGFLCEVKK